MKREPSNTELYLFLILAITIIALVIIYSVSTLNDNDTCDHDTEYQETTETEESSTEETKEPESTSIVTTVPSINNVNAESAIIHTYSTSKTVKEIEEIIYIIKNGDSLWSIATEYYDDGNYCYPLAEYNNITIDDNLYSGMEIVIPNKNNIKFIDIINNMIDEDNETSISGIIKGDINGTEYQYGVRTTPKVDITIPDNGAKNYTEAVDTSNYTYIGDWNITAYDPECAHCCGGNTHSIGAAGVEIIPGYSVATKDLPLGVTLYIEGYGFYINEDRGCGDGVIDIAADSHETCYETTSSSPVKVYIVE